MTKPFPFHGADANLRPHLQGILDGKEYGAGKINFPYPPTIIDLGANIGAYSYWVLSQVPNAFVYAYEAEPTNVSNYIKNMTEVFGMTNQWRIFYGALNCSSNATVPLFKSKVNSGMHSLLRQLTNTPCAEVVNVPSYHPHRLPNCDILKLDIEGSELEVLRAYLVSHLLPSVISLEFHSRYDYYEIEQLLAKDYIPIKGHILHADIGTMNYVHNNIFKENK